LRNSGLRTQLEDSTNQMVVEQTCVPVCAMVRAILGFALKYLTAVGTSAIVFTA
jgi:hypothetical protein